MNYDLGDPARWEYMFPNMEKPLLAVPNVNEDLLEVDDEEVCMSKMIIFISQLPLEYESRIV